MSLDKNEKNRQEDSLRDSKSALRQLIAAIGEDSQVKDICQKMPQNVAGIHQGIFPFLLFHLFYHKTDQVENEDMVVVFSTDVEARQCYQETLFLAESLESPEIDQGDLLFFPSWGVLPYTYSRVDKEKEGLRAKALSRLLSHDRNFLIITSIDAIAQKIPEPEVHRDSLLRLKRGERYPFDELRAYFESHDYERVDIVDNYNQYSIKGSVIDLFTPAYSDPIRIDFFGDEIESMHLFDPQSQRSYREIKEIMLFPGKDLVLSGVDYDKLNEKIKERFGDLSEKTLPPFVETRGHDMGGLWDIYPLFCHLTSFYDYLSPGAKTIYYEAGRTWERIASRAEEIDFLRKKNEEKLLLDSSELFFSRGELEAIAKDSRDFFPLVKSPDDYAAAFPEPIPFKGKVSRFVEEINEQFKNKGKVFISAETETQIDRIEHILQGYRELSFQPSFFISPLRKGLIWKGGVLVTERELFGKSARIGRIHRSSTKVIESFTDLGRGDYVVHVNYGIGKFYALKRMKIAGNERDFLELEFADKDKLYVPLEQLNLVHKYIGSTDQPRLDHLGKKSSWEKTKKKVDEAVEIIAGELLELYARRESARGIVYPSDSHFQEEFEASFPYDETDHQIATINEVKKDMESERPMDRLICGDVGFGKTEVAIRAAFKAVMAGKQVCVLCPTTILAFQHYNNFKARFENYPVSVDYLSRFRTASEVKKIKVAAKEGKVDIIIGTHAILAEDIHWKNLGLLVIDEEQRFGVVHKEKIKKFKSNVDSISMTATPIPRTLQMSLIGIRDLSIIETPPRNRRKIETYVMEENDQVLVSAIRNELKRGGQVFILHNKVKTIEVQANRIRSLYPKAVLGVLHGQMGENEIEQRMLDFYSQKYDILLSTTIIESGIDIPNANTLIVLNSQNFGLSQLYQIKGRVGRSERQAYAYFFYPQGMAMSEIAQKRLNTLMEHDGLGEGFKIAMKDLEIRGAGNLLGKEQSGDIMAVGFELYVKMLRDKLADMKNEVRESEFETQVTVDQDFFFPDDYISDIRQKMEFYKKLASAGDIATIDDISFEMKDRFGEAPPVVRSMILQEKLRVLARTLRIEKISWVKDRFALSASGETKINVDKLTRLISGDQRFAPDPKDPRKLHFIPGSAPENEAGAAVLHEMCGVLEYLA